ncbi:MAG TPA: hypothetical protein VM238_06960 [Phycisphaerae bacterium]|nr:hypothetical protein [Phycisphaerae bacterium]
MMPARTLILPAVALLVLASVAAAAGPVRVFPGKTWETREPAEVGLDASALKACADYVGGRACVVRHGFLVYTWGDVSKRADVASAAKAVYAHFLFKALENGKIPSLNQPAMEWEPRLRGINAALGHKDRGITWRHFANQISCYGLAEKPGAAYAYNDWQMALFWDTLFLKVYGATFDNVDETVLRPLLTDRIGCEDKPTMMAFGTANRPGRLAISCRDFARFGLLYMNKGNWNGKQILAEPLAVKAVSEPVPNAIPRAGGVAAEMIPGQRSIGSTRIPDNQTDHMGSYSWLWWTNGVDREGKRHWPGVPTDACGAFGHGGKRAMVVIPSLDLITSWNDATCTGRERENKALKLLVGAVR